jgi:threonine/homoserine/homoserine lactone efflux protein
MLLTDELLGFVLAGLALTGSPGPANLGLAAAGAAFGVRRGPSADKGGAVAMRQASHTM